MSASTLLQSYNGVNLLELYETVKSITSKQDSLVIGGIALKHEIADIKEHWLNAKIRGIIKEVSSMKSQTCPYFDEIILD